MALPGAERARPGPFLAPSPTIDSDHPSIREWAAAVAGEEREPLRVVVRLYYAVRDAIRYDPYSVRLDPEHLRASATLAAGRGYCVAKAALLAAGCRARGIAARLGFADVRNHLATRKLLERMGTDVFYWHGYASLAPEGRFVKATPAFDRTLCERFGIRPLEYDGREDSIFHPFDAEGRRHMEYLRDRGEFEDVPYEAIRATFARRYPKLVAEALDADPNAAADRFDREIEEDRGTTRSPGPAPRRP